MEVSHPLRNHLPVKEEALRLSHQKNQEVEEDHQFQNLVAVEDRLRQNREDQEVGVSRLHQNQEKQEDR